MWFLRPAARNWWKLEGKSDVAPTLPPNRGHKMYERGKRRDPPAIVVCIDDGNSPRGAYLWYTHLPRSGTAVASNSQSWYGSRGAALLLVAQMRILKSFLIQARSVGHIAISSGPRYDAQLRTMFCFVICPHINPFLSPAQRDVRESSTSITFPHSGDRGLK